MKNSTTVNTQITPSNFTSHPFGSILQHSESETIATNIMKILSITGNTFRELTYDEYKSERLKDGNFSEREKGYFDKVISYCKSPDSANLFCKDWYKK